MVTRPLVIKFMNFYDRITLAKSHKPPYKHIVQLGDPVLRYKSRPVEKSDLESPEFKKLLTNMQGAVKRYKCAGVSAPQLGVDLRVIALWFPKPGDYHGSPTEYERKQMQPFPYTVWINPVLKVLDYKKLTFAEGCESMRGFSADVPRYTRVQLSGWDERGLEHSSELSGWLARSAQHELDHLDGRMFLDAAHLPSLRCSFWDRINSTGGRVFMSYYPNKMFSKA